MSALEQVQRLLPKLTLQEKRTLAKMLALQLRETVEEEGTGTADPEFYYQGLHKAALAQAGERLPALAQVRRRWKDLMPGLRHYFEACERWIGDTADPADRLRLRDYLATLFVERLRHDGITPNLFSISRNARLAAVALHDAHPGYAATSMARKLVLSALAGTPAGSTSASRK